jgi:hypothetical protein
MPSSGSRISTFSPSNFGSVSARSGSTGGAAAAA